MKLTGGLENALTGPAPEIGVFPAAPGPLAGAGIVIPLPWAMECIRWLCGGM